MDIRAKNNPPFTLMGKKCPENGIPAKSLLIVKTTNVFLPEELGGALRFNA